METVVSTLIGVAAGSVVTWLSARHYYRQAAKDLQKEADRFSALIDQVFSSFESSGWLRVERDEKGRVLTVHPRFGLGTAQSRKE